MSCEQWFWISPDGQSRELTNLVNRTEVTRGSQNRFAPPVVISRQAVPFRAGAVTTSVRHDVRPYMLPLAAVGSYDELNETLAELGQIFDSPSMDGLPGTLRFVGNDGRIKELICRQTAVLDPQALVGSEQKSLQLPQLRFEADDPYWLGEVINPPSWTGATPGSWFPGEPWALGSSTVLGNATLIVQTDVPTFPVWTIVGPASSFSVTNTITGEELAWTAAVSSGGVVRIDTAEGAKTITGPDGSNWFGHLTSYDFWPLRRGTNHINLSLGDATSASYISVFYRTRTLAP